MREGVEREERREWEPQRDRRQRARRIRPPPEQAQGEDDGERRGDEEEDTLHLDEQRILLRRVIQRDGDAQEQDQRSGNLAEADLLLLAGVGPEELLVEVDGDPVG